MKCYQAKARQLTPQWYVIDASDVVVGRLAAQIAPMLMGKHRPTYTPHIDTGDYIIVTNVEKVVFTGKKWEQQTYARYSGYPGGLKVEPAWRLRQRHPERILYEAVRRMMPKNKIGRHMLSKLKLYVGPQHPHQAQQPMPLDPYKGRPAASGAIWAPEPVESTPKPKKKRPARAEEPDETATAATESAAQAAPPVADVAPVPETPQAEAALPDSEPQAAAEAEPQAKADVGPPQDIEPEPVEPSSQADAPDEPTDQEPEKKD
ncbi:hypothetical protein BH23PLA1_BH23PLA1_15100 [soil metagenome]